MQALAHLIIIALVVAFVALAIGLAGQGLWLGAAACVAFACFMARETIFEERDQ